MKQPSRTMRLTLLHHAFVEEFDTERILKLIPSKVQMFQYW